MASDVDIANLALARLGDDATVSSMDPPEGSVQAEQCARFYPLARDTLLGMNAWNFATRRKQLARYTDRVPPSTWAYAYAPPNEMITALAILAPDAPDDYSTPYALPYSAQSVPGALGMAMGYQPRAFVVESLDDDRKVIYTNQEDAVLRYVARVSDANRYSALFMDALTWLLASHLAGPLIKGDAGAAAAQTAYQAFLGAFQRATAEDAQQRKVNLAHSVPWISNR